MYKKNQYIIVRSEKAGVFAGYFHSKDGNAVTLTNARRLWYWKGAASLSQMATSGTSDPQGCKFPIAVEKVELFGVIEILNTTPLAKQSIEGVSLWIS